MYDPATAIWKDLSAAATVLPSPRYNHGFATFEAQLFLQGGQDVNGSEMFLDYSMFLGYCSTFVRLRGYSQTSHTNCWTIYLFSGYRNDLLAYDISRAIWTDLTSPPTGTPPSARQAHGFAAVNGQLFVHAGTDASGANVTISKAF